jgi:dipeptidyl aminopeptidase/acylaminoacyl peptidase
LFDPNARLRAAYHPRVRYLRWSIGGGGQAAGVLMLPESGPRSPAPFYLNYYRCDGFLRGGVGDEWPMPQLLEAGYAVACINSIPFSGPQDGVRNYDTGLRAVGALIDRLAGDGAIDPTRVAMGGLSFGSEVAFWIALHSHLLALLSVSSLQFEPAGYWMGAMPGSDIPGTMLKVWGLGDPDKTPARWGEVAPALNADKLRIPILFQLPENEARRIPELYARLSEEGAPTELYAFPDEAHLKLQPRHRLAVYERNLDWIRYWLEGYRDPDPIKAGQYRRWDRLRSRWKNSPAPTARTEATARARPSH